MSDSVCFFKKHLFWLVESSMAVKLNLMITSTFLLVKALDGLAGGFVELKSGRAWKNAHLLTYIKHSLQLIFPMSNHVIKWKERKCLEILSSPYTVHPFLCALGLFFLQVYRYANCIEWSCKWKSLELNTQLSFSCTWNVHLLMWFRVKLWDWPALCWH